MSGSITRLLKDVMMDLDLIFLHIWVSEGRRFHETGGENIWFLCFFFFLFSFSFVCGFSFFFPLRILFSSCQVVYRICIFDV